VELTFIEPKQEVDMNVFDTLHLTRLEMGLLLVVIALTAMLIRSKQRPRSADLLQRAIEFEGLRDWVKEAEAICENLSKNLQEKRKLAKRLMGQLDAKIERMGQLVERANTEESLPREEVKNKELQPVIVEMADSGCPVSQIARWLRIPEGEVQLVLDLKKFNPC
jgi:hypothetical protein